MARVDFIWLPEGHEGQGELAIAIDGELLTEVFRKVEERFTSQPGELARPGRYRGITGGELGRSAIRHFEGGPDSHLYSGPEGKTVLVSCECGEVGCWPLMATVVLHDSTVVWCDFENPCRTEQAGERQERPDAIWDYGDLTFTFDRRQYSEALTAVAAEIQAWREGRSG